MKPGVIKLVLLVALAGIARPVVASDLAFLKNGFSIRHERREVLGTITRLYISADNKGYVDVPTEQIDHYEPDLTPAPTPFSAPATTAFPLPAPSLDQVINQASDKHQLDADLIHSVIRAESGFNPRAVSPKGAQGLMQLMPGTASELGVPNAFDPQANVEGGTKYLRWLLERYHFDLAKALAAYNAGPHRVEQYRGVPPYYETHAYVAKVIRDFNRKKLAEQKAAGQAQKSQPKVPKTASARQKPASGNSSSR